MSGAGRSDVSERIAERAPTVAIVGGGLAGLAAAVALTSAGCSVELFESRRVLGGRAGSFRDPDTGQYVDHCQHVSMGCCTNLADFCRRTETSGLFRRDERLTFMGPRGETCEFQASRLLPAPLHLMPAFWGLKYLAPRDRWQIARAMWKLMRCGTPVDDAHAPTIGAWLAEQGQSPAAIENFWSVILVSALGETLERASLAAARKVIVDGFLTSREAYAVEVPEVPLDILYGQRVTQWLTERGTVLHLNTPIRQVTANPGPQVTCADGRVLRPDYVVVAVPWTKLAELVDPDVARHWNWLDTMRRVGSSPITAVHLWFDRTIMNLPHAVLVGRLSQWVFQRSESSEGGNSAGHYYQVVISASRQLAGRDRQDIVREVCQDLAASWPAAAQAQLLASRVVTQHEAVFSVRAGLDACRPAQRTTVSGVVVAGDWTATGWPATMEGAVRSGYLAAEAVMAQAGQPRTFLAPDLPWSPLARWLIRR